MTTDDGAGVDGGNGHGQTPIDAGPAARWAAVLRSSADEVRSRWLQLVGGAAGNLPAANVAEDATDLLRVLGAALADPAGGDVDGPAYASVRQVVADTSARRGRASATPVSTASYVFGLREALLDLPGSATGPESASDIRWLTRLVDRLALLTLDSYVEGRQDVISQQGQQLLELSTPVVSLWDRVVAAPLVGTLDSARAQVVMESLLQAIVDEGALVAILDITGVPTVDTLVAQHLLKTVAATRLMGAECIVSGIRPQTAQTIVQLGIDLTQVTTRASLADALSTAIERVEARDARVTAR